MKLLRISDHRITKPLSWMILKPRENTLKKITSILTQMKMMIIRPHNMMKMERIESERYGRRMMKC